MAVTWTISTLERNTSDDGVVVAHWRATDVDGEHLGYSYGICGFTPDSTAEGATVNNSCATMPYFWCEPSAFQSNERTWIASMSSEAEGASTMLSLSRWSDEVL